MEAVLQHQVERAAREWLAFNETTRSGRPRLALDPPSFELVLQQPNRAEFGITAKNNANDLRLTLDHHKLTVLRAIAERRDAAHPHSLSLRGGNLVADALADDLALELRKGQQNVEGQTVESECDAGGFRSPLSVAAPFVWRCLTRSPVAPVSTPRSSNRTCRFAASGSRTRRHAFTHDGPRPSWVRRTSRKYP